VTAGQKAVAPVAGLQGLAATAAGEHHERGEILVFAAEPVAEPGAHGGSAGLLMAGAEESHGRVVVNRDGVQGADQGDVIDDAAGVGQQFAEFGPLAAVTFERVGRSDAQPGRLPGGHAGDALPHAHARRQFDAGHSASFGLGSNRSRCDGAPDWKR
jgi:hypothetical protein